MNKKKIVGYLGVALFLVGIFFLINERIDITGAVIGILDIPSNFSFVLGIALIIISIILFAEGNLEERLEDKHHWKLYQFNKLMIAEDVEKGYLKRKQQRQNLTPMIERIERSVTAGKTIKEPYQEHTYLEHYDRESKGGRIIELNSHIVGKGKYSGKFVERIRRWWNKGKLEHFNKLANGWYIWVVDEKENFVIGNRATTESFKFGHKLPHPVLAAEMKIYGAGEVLIEDGLIKEYNSGTGHYFDRRNPRGFDKQSKEVFDYFRKRAGWKEVRGGAKYGRKHDLEDDSINY